MNEPKNVLTTPPVERGKEVAPNTIELDREYTRAECMQIMNAIVFPELIRRGFYSADGIKKAFADTIRDIVDAPDATSFIFYEHITTDTASKGLWLRTELAGIARGATVCLMPYAVTS